MKLKIGFGEGGIKGFLMRHAEKLIFGVVILLVMFFVYSSATQEGISLSDTPEKLKADAQTARQHVTENHWRSLEEERVKKVGNYPARAEEIRTPIRDDQYAPDRPLLQRDPTPSQQPRRDPELFAPLKVEAKGGVYSIAWRLTKPDDPLARVWAGDRDAVAKVEEAPKPKRPRRDRRKPTYGDDYDMMYSSEEMMGPGSDSYMDEGSGPGIMGGTTAGARRVSNWFLEHYVKGVRGTAGMATGAGRGMVVPRHVGMVSVTALVPYERQWDEYERALADAMGYAPAADVPRYLFYEAERAEVGDDPDAPLKWETISNTAIAARLSLGFGGQSREIADPGYVLPGVLTMPIPPVLIKSFEELALHSEVPKFQPRQQAMAARRPEDLQGLSPDATPEDLAGQDSGMPPIPKAAPGQRGAMGQDMYDGAEEYGMQPGMGSGGYDEEGYDTGGYGTAPGQVRRPVAKFLMIRFYDMRAEAGKTYRYRVRVGLEDSNRPQNPQSQPTRRILDPSVVARLDKVEASDQESLKETGTPRRTFFIRTDWSEPSDVVKVQGNEGFLAGAVTPGRFVRLVTRPGEQGPEVQISESAGNLLVVAWDRRRAVEVPAERSVRRGAFLNFDQDADVMHPLTTQLKTVADYSFNTGGLVLDLRGGDPLIVDGGESRNDEKKILTTPGEFIVVDGRGNLIVCNEIDDTEEFRRLMFIEEGAQVVGGGMMDYGPGSDMGMDYGYEDSGYFGP